MLVGREMHLGKRIKLVRIYKSITQNELADRIGRTRALIAFIEKSGKVNKRTLEDIVKVLGVSQTELDNFGENAVMVKEELSGYRKKLENSEEKLKALQAEISILKDLLDTQKKVIALQETQLKKLGRGKSK